MDIIGEAFKQGLIPGVVIAVVYIVEKIISTKKKNPLVDIAQLLSIVTKDIIEKDRERAKAAVDIIFNNEARELAKFVQSTIINNNIDFNKEQIINNAKYLVNSVYYNTYSKLNMYRGVDDYLGKYMQERWKDDLYQDMIEIIYNKNIEPVKRILAYNNRIDIRVKDCASYIINNAF